MKISESENMHTLIHLTCTPRGGGGGVEPELRMGGTHPR